MSTLTVGAAGAGGAFDYTCDGTADHAEIDALAALTGQHLTLNINGVEYPGVMIRPPMLETQLTPAAWAYQIGFVQETRHA